MPVDKDPGEQWRWREGPYPNDSDNNRFQAQLRQGTEWTTMWGVDAEGYPHHNLVHAAYTEQAGQSIAHGTTWITVNFASKLTDTHDAVTVGTSWIFTAPTAGVYAIDTIVNFNSAAVANPDITMAILINGVAQHRGTRFNATIPSPSQTGVGSGITRFLNKGDTVAIGAYQANGSGAARTLEGGSSHISITLVPGA